MKISKIISRVFSIDMRFKLVGNQRVSPNADVSPSQLCAVCQGKEWICMNKYFPIRLSLSLFRIDSAQCQHYGVRTCEGKSLDAIHHLSMVSFFLGCKGFFKVNSNNPSKSINFICLTFCFLANSTKECEICLFGR